MKQRYGRAGDGSIRIFGDTLAAQSARDAASAIMLVQENRSSMKWSSWRLVALLLAMTTVIGFAEATQVFLGIGAQGRPIKYYDALASTMPSWFMLALLLPIAIMLARRFRLDEKGWRLALPVHLAASVVFALVHLGLSSWVSDYVLLSGSVPFLSNITRIFTLFFVVDTLYYWGMIGGYYAFEYGRRYREEERSASQLALQASRLETSLSRANLEALRMQLNPHFLFNTLNTISVLAMKGERQPVVRMINRLSDLLRLSLENNRQTMTLGEEVDFLQRYLEIEQVRFRDRLTVRVDVPDDLLDAEVPSLILQPLVENAVVHGVSQQLEGGVIEITGRRTGDRLVLIVRDTGPGFRNRADRNGTGVGMSNTAARLEQLYGANHSIQAQNGAEGGATVTLDLPYRVLSRDSQDEVEWNRSAL
jgi:two-component system, LytTR family, sensor kinase